MADKLNLSADEKRYYGQLFQQADTERLGVVTGEIAVRFFEKTKVAPNVLGEIWQIADSENRGLLTKAGFSVALRLIGHYQAGREPSPELAFRRTYSVSRPLFLVTDSRYSWTFAQVRRRASTCCRARSCTCTRTGRRSPPVPRHGCPDTSSQPRQVDSIC